MIKRNTIQCHLVFEAVNNLRCHATAEEIFDTVQKEHPHIGRGTVYRNLNRLSEMGEIRKIEIPGGAECFDHQCHEHYHIRCVKCARVFDVDMEYIADLESRIKSTHGFEFICHDIIFKGVCPQCAAANSVQGTHGS